MQRRNDQISRVLNRGDYRSGRDDLEQLRAEIGGGGKLSTAALQMELAQAETGVRDRLAAEWARDDSTAPRRGQDQALGAAERVQAAIADQDARIASQVQIRETDPLQEFVNVDKFGT